MVYIKQFTIKFLLFALSHATVFCMDPAYLIVAEFNPNGSQIAFSYSDHSTKIWNTEHNTLQEILPTNIEPEFDIKKENKRTLEHNSIKIFHDKRIIMVYKGSDGVDHGILPKDILSCALNAHNKKQPVIATGFNNETNLYTDLDTWKPCSTLVHKEGTYSSVLAFNTHGTQLVSCTNDGKATLYSLENNQLISSKAININSPKEQIIITRSNRLKHMLFIAAAGLCLMWLCYMQYLTSMN